MAWCKFYVFPFSLLVSDNGQRVSWGSWSLKKMWTLLFLANNLRLVYTFAWVLWPEKWFFFFKKKKLIYLLLLILIVKFIWNFLLYIMYIEHFSVCNLWRWGVCKQCWWGFYATCGDCSYWRGNAEICVLC